MLRVLENAGFLRRNRRPLFRIPRKVTAGVPRFFKACARRLGILGTHPKDEKPEGPRPAQSDLVAAVRRARVENAERAEAITDLREIEAARLALLESALKSVVGQAPPGVDLFDLALAPGEHPRLFIDMIAFVDMAHDRRTYRFHQDTRHGRVLIAESQSIDKVTAAVTNYVARRLVERERALASDPGSGEAQTTVARAPRARPIAQAPVRAPPRLEDEAAKTVDPAVWPRRRFAARLGDVFSFLVMTLGSVTLILLLGLGAYLAWTVRLRDVWAHWFGAPPL